MNGDAVLCFLSFCSFKVFSVGASGHTYPNDFAKKTSARFVWFGRISVFFKSKKLGVSPATPPTGKHSHSRGKGLLV